MGDITKLAQSVGRFEQLVNDYERDVQKLIELQKEMDNAPYLKPATDKPVETVGNIRI